MSQYRFPGAYFTLFTYSAKLNVWLNEVKTISSIFVHCRYFEVYVGSLVFVSSLLRGANIIELIELLHTVVTAGGMFSVYTRSYRTISGTRG